MSFLCFVCFRVTEKSFRCIVIILSTHIFTFFLKQEVFLGAYYKAICSSWDDRLLEHQPAA